MANTEWPVASTEWLVASVELNHQEREVQSEHLESKTIERSEHFESKTVDNSRLSMSRARRLERDVVSETFEWNETIVTGVQTAGWMLVPHVGEAPTCKQLVETPYRV